MIYEHEEIERKVGMGGGFNIAPPPDPIKEQWALDSMRDYLESRGLSYQLALMNGCYPIDYKGLRMYIPARTRIPEHVFWQARTLEGHPLRYDSPHGSREGAVIVMSNRSFYNHIGLCVLVIVEGPLDALAVAELDSHVGVSLMGNTPDAKSLDHVCAIIAHYPPLKVACVADRDAVTSMAKVQSYLAMRGISSELKVPLDKKDIACYSVEERKRFLK